MLDAPGLAALEKRVADRNAAAARRAVAAADPDAKEVLTFMYTDTKCEKVPAQFAKVNLLGPLPEIKRVNGELSYKDALKEALVEEMAITAARSRSPKGCSKHLAAIVSSTRPSAKPAFAGRAAARP